MMTWPMLGIERTSVASIRRSCGTAEIRRSTRRMRIGRATSANSPVVRGFQAEQDRIEDDELDHERIEPWRRLRDVRTPTPGAPAQRVSY